MTGKEIRPGYKHTEVGVIPDDWEVRRFSDHFTIYAGGDVPKHSLSKIRTEACPYPIFANAIQNRGLYGFTGEQRAKADSLTVTARGYLGHAEHRTEPFFPIVRLLVLEPNASMDAKFTTYAINDRVEFAIESTGVPQLTAPQIGKYAFASPPDVDEQRAIAAALEDADTLIAALEGMIAKKRDLKQAAMQHLLTGKTRLPGFSGEWEVKRLGDFASFLSGTYLAKTDYRPGKFVVQGAGAAMGEHNSANFPFAITVIGRVGTVGRPRFISGGCWVNNNAGAIRALPNMSEARYVHLLLTQYDWSLATSVTAQPFLGVGTLMGALHEVPPKEEQSAIADVIFDMDADLAALEAQAAKARAVKQGMMQELLTGRVRLI